MLTCFCPLTEVSQHHHGGHTLPHSYDPCPEFSFEVPDPRTSAAAKSNYGALLAPAIKEIEILDSQVVFWNNHMIAH
ncbi:hypothetical protein DI09_80p120 [Mitosporidium daphniae]|uniref:Uncharacterized protein n=1 Tax=Mitosporidium daphniae TaxID=1485682 RepID=A0A098VN09_9MICR|nr:uncharacterized protein DI09_82p130 [Mitosporidium daphniae]XP_013236645.1 uncharacterized protein DI09_80p120 [Mitosporidium daphniae]KGG50194.1 hypothetical protein DI09_82p130 [Mitosporidium daphniae]KGG50218.1 hypothetical protein DI09_80p120 [Mitosporidium daphniae]|eukprot:XP_013236621.1 uncharacterized protein DI09_82p130 [Mitosporidium daphniae]